MPARKKDPSVRARRNRATTATTLTLGDTYEVPELPEHPSASWHPRTVEWWNQIWSSPLPGSWQNFDLVALEAVALVFNDIWIAETPRDRKDALGEFRLQRKDFFIAPYDRLRGEIAFEEADEAKDRGRQRRARQSPSAGQQPSSGDDPRSVLRAVK